MWNSNIAVTKEKETFTSRKYLFTFLGILWDVLCVYESHILDESPFLDFNWHLSLIYWNFIFKEKMINLPRLMDTILEWRGSNCFGHHYFMHFKMKQTKPGSLLRLLFWQSGWPTWGQEAWIELPTSSYELTTLLPTLYLLHT